MKKHTLRAALYGTIFSLFVLSLPTLAQAPGGGGPQPGGGGGSGGATVTPIDGGASLLLASGAAYALKRLRRRA